MHSFFPPAPLRSFATLLALATLCLRSLLRITLLASLGLAGATCWAATPLTPTNPTPVSFGSQAVGTAESQVSVTFS